MSARLRLALFTLDAIGAMLFTVWIENLLTITSVSRNAPAEWGLRKLETTAPAQG